MVSSHKVAIIIPTFNSANYLKEAINSSIRQVSNDSAETIIVDDGSTDETKALVAPYVDGRYVRYIRQDNAGPSAARNNGIVNSSSEFITFLDADDILLDGCVQRSVELLTEHSPLGLVFQNYEVFDGSKTIQRSGVDAWSVFRSLDHTNVRDDCWIFKDPLAIHLVKYGYFMATSGITIRRAFLRDSGLFRAEFSYAEDLEFFSRYCLRCRSGYIDQVLSRVRVHVDSQIHSAARRLRNTKDHLEVSELQLKEFGAYPHLTSALHGVVQKLIVDYSWGLLETGRRQDAERILFKYVRRYFWNVRLHKLIGRCLLSRVGLRRPM